MWQGFFKRCFSFFLCCLIAVSYTINSASPNELYDGGRDSRYDGGSCDTGTIKYDPLTRNRDLIWELSNSYCAAFVAGAGATMVAAGTVAYFGCRGTTPLGSAKQVYEQAAEGGFDEPIVSPNIIRRTANRFSRCAARFSEASTYSGMAAAGDASAGVQAGIATADGVKCCAATSAYVAAVGVALGVLSAVWEAAKKTYEGSHMCGEGWNKWERQCKSSENTSCTDSEKIWVKTKGDYQRCLFKAFAENNLSAEGCDEYRISNETKITNSSYREYIFGGYEIEDSECKNPGWSNREKMSRLGYDSVYQRYYTRGGGESISFACHRFLSSDKSDIEAIKAFECCKKRSQETTCVHIRGVSGTSDEFCKVGEKCQVEGVTIEVYDSKVKPNHFCVKTYSFCPYNHLLGGGTEQYIPDPADSSVTTNTCQYLYHCTRVPILPLIRTSNLDGGYISSSCKDMKGDSQNFYSYDAGIIPLNTKNFSAPIAQCFKETLENILLNVAGDTKCINPDESPVDEACTSGYIYRKGLSLPGDSIFTKIQNRLQSTIKILLIISITMFGVMILFAVPNAAIEKKKLLPYILKIALVLYFATGDAWQTQFMSGVLNSSTFISEMVFNVDETAEASKLDGCQFPRYNYAIEDEATKYNKPSYPPLKGYLKIWDTLDCKLAKALGFGPEVSVPNIILMLIGGLFTGGLGIVFVVASLMFSFLLIAMIIRALHIFLLSIISMVILIYVSPITIAASLFERTKGIFQGWLKQLLGFALQPMILFAYLSIMISVFDYVTMGPDIRFTGNGKSQMKIMVCDSEASKSSLYCIFRAPNIKTNHALEVIGIGIPFLVGMTPEKLNTIIKGALLMFIFYSFMEKISYFAKKLVGGAELKGEAPSVAGMAKKTLSVASGVRKRFANAVDKHGVRAAKKIGKVTKSIARGSGSKGKSMSRTQDDYGSNTAKSDGGYNDTRGSGQGNSSSSGGGSSNNTNSTP